MNSIQISTNNNLTLNKSTSSIWNNYLSYAQSQEKNRMLWYAISLAIIPCALIPLSLFAMHFATANMVWFMAFVGPLFFSNVIAHMVEVPAKFFIALFYLTIGLLLLVPIVAFFIN